MLDVKILRPLIVVFGGVVATHGDFLSRDSDGRPHEEVVVIVEVLLQFSTVGVLETKRFVSFLVVSCIDHELEVARLYFCFAKHPAVEEHAFIAE